MQNEPEFDIRILIVDDILTMRRLLISMLRFLGYRNIAIAEDGLEAWEILTKEKIDLIISDWKMPKMSGIELLYKVRSAEDHENLPFIMISGELDEGNVSLVMGMEVDAYLIKPFVPKELEEKILIAVDHKKNPTNYQQLLTIGRKWQRENDLLNAIQFFNTAINISPDKTLAYCYLGNVQEKMAGWKEAKSAYEKALSLNAQCVRALEGLSRVYSVLGDKAGLLRVRTSLMGVYPLSIDRLMALVDLALQVGENEKARSCLWKVIGLQPDDKGLTYTVAKLFLDNDMIDDADNLFEKLIKQEPDNIEYLNCFGEVLMQKTKYDHARTVFMKSLGLKETATIHFKLAQLYIRLGSRRLAEHHLESALLVDRQFSEAAEMLKRLDEIIASSKNAAKRQ